MVWPIGLLFLGSLLGVSTILSTGASLALRLPALLAALIMFSQAVIELTPKGRRATVRATTLQTVEPEPIVMSSAEVQRARSPLPSNAGYPSPMETSAGAAPARRYVPVLMIGLALWLGVAVLFNVGDAPRLSALATIAAFLLFAFGWLDLSGRRPSS